MQGLETIIEAAGLEAVDRARLKKCLTVLARHAANNRRRSMYYNESISANSVNIGIAVPDNMKVAADITCPWARKAVSTLANRSIFEGFVHIDGDAEGMEELDTLVMQNDLVNRYRKSLRAELVHGVNFVTVARGYAEMGEPKAVVNMHSADEAAAVWDNRANRISYGMAVVDTDSDGHPIMVNLYTDTHTIEISRADIVSKWHAEYMPHFAGRPLIEALSYNPDELHPFGQSRITEPVMSIIDSYLRTRLRLEIGAELFTSPQKVISGASDEAFEMDKFESYITKVLLLGKDEDGDTPSISMLQATSMQPHIDIIRSLAAQFSGATNTPISELGIVHDNPASAQAIYAASEPLVIDAQNLNADNGAALVNIAVLMLAISRNVPAEQLTEERANIQARFKNPALPSLVANADSAVKICTSCPSFAGTDVYWEMLGFNQADIARINSDIIKNSATIALSELFKDRTDDNGATAADAD